MNVNTFYDQKLFFLWDAFRKQMPGSSQTAFISSLEDLSRSNNSVIFYYCTVTLLTKLIFYQPLMCLICVV
jgi:hypothetical protein